MYQSVEAILNPKLDAGERLLWCGQPPGGVRLRAADALLVPFSLLWGGFAICWETMALTAVGASSSNPLGFLFPLFGLPFVLIGLYLIFGRFFVDARIRAQTCYGVTNERIIILSGLFSQQLKSLQLRTLTDISLTESADGSGTILFGAAPMMAGMFANSSWPGAGRNAVPSSAMIENAKNVYDIIRQAQKPKEANV